MVLNVHRNDQAYQGQRRNRNTLTCLRPRCVRAEHSMYLTARILLASLMPCSRLTGDKPCAANNPIASLFSLRSILVPVPVAETTSQSHFSFKKHHTCVVAETTSQSHFRFKKHHISLTECAHASRCLLRMIAF